MARAEPVAMGRTVVDGYAGVTDPDLVRGAQAGDDRAVDELLRRYRPAVRARVANYFLAGGDRDDLLQEARFGLCKAIRDFDPDHGASFAAFADLCITRQVLTAIKTATRLKHAPLNSYVPIDRPHKDDPSRTIADVVAIDEDPDPLDQLVADAELQRLRAAADEVLSALEADVFDLYVDGRSYHEIADHLGRHAKAVDNAIQRIKRKLERRLALDA